ncbi:MAG: cisplatin damage response ATP-dependent DNA ligase, partial [Alphaproteobacteria bacterium]|nr:cisplatin damage response ATP-dependent DNA ligase [Alphaproteobacteria bacterium]
LAKASLAAMGGVDLGEIEEVWHGMEPPYSTLFAWLEGREDRPSLDGRAVFRPLMLATELAAEDLERLDPDAYVAEWKWDGLRVQLASVSGERRLYSRAGDDISGAFPEIIEAMTFDGVRDGELLVMRNGEVAPFGDLEKRLGRATVSARSLSELPAHVRLYDVLFDGEDDLRELRFEDRRRRLEALVERENPARMDLSDLIPFQFIGDLDALRAACRDRGVEGLILKRRDSAYVAGRPSGPWIKWKCEPLTVDAVLMYALCGSGGASAGNAAFTLGVWRGEELVPAGKVFTGFTDEELARLEEWVRDHTLKRHGPVREVEQSLVIEFAFDSVRRSSRHKSGIVTRGQRAHRIRWDKPAAEADRLDALERWAG